ncbi:lipopolysaccharide biosynthesis protein [Oceanobacillus jeddahense]|uniref:lipopolysaccharide biosynthesis protein n=1 Tax=Oceanobacillus jeddahense TaxID=1462527 RepID=UPI000595F081|nr:lipopolysaccharide biosynthesis protein [Oceanobacillus jeddahense]
MSNNKQLKKKTLTGLIWSFVDLMANQGIQFIIMIILARLLVPEHFGLLGMIMIFVALSQTLVDSGFSQSLIREKTVSKLDYSTVFIFNIIFSIVIFLLIYFIAPLVSNFYNEPQITSILRVIGLVVFFQAISIVPKTILTRKVDFKAQAKASVISSISSGVIAIVMAYAGFGVWSLVFRIIIQKMIESFMLIYINRWIPTFKFSMSSFKRFFGFGWKLLVSSLIDTFYMNIYYVIIGKMYTTRDLGLYTNSRQLKDAINNGITQSIQRVTYPVLSSIQSKEAELKQGFKKLIKLTSYVFFPVMLGIAAIANSFLILLLGQKWEGAVFYFQLLCISSILFPLQAINLNILKVKGRSDLFLRLEIIKKVLVTIALLVTILLNLGVASFIVTAIITAHISLLINTYYSGKEIGYGTKEQIKDIFPAYLTSFLMAIVVYSLGLVLNTSLLLTVLIQVTTGVFIYIILSKISNKSALDDMINILRPLLLKVIKKK